MFASSRNDPTSRIHALTIEESSVTRALHESYEEQHPTTDHSATYSENYEPFPSLNSIELPNEENLQKYDSYSSTDETYHSISLKKPECCANYQHQKFYKGCKWSPDCIANRILTCDGDNKLRIYHTFLNRNDYANSQISNEFYELNNIGKIYDFDWYPIVDPSQYYVLAASSLGPVHIWDMVTSKSEASYRMYNTKDEAVHAHCVTCSSDGQQLYAATSDYIFLFDVNRPGRTFDYISTRPHFRRAIISAITLNPIRNSMFAVGTYNNRIGIYDETQLLCVLYGHTKGITYLRFSPNGTLLFSGVRGNGEIICWDLRNPGTALYKLNRVVRTQQRIYFDFAANGKYVVSGSTNGDVYVWDTLSPPEDDTLSPVCIFEAHDDCTNGISVNKNSPVITTVSGQYHENELPYLLYDSNDEEESDPAPSLVIENSLKLWHYEW